MVKPTASSPKNPLIHRPERSLPTTMAIIGAGTIGPDIAYYLKSALPDLTLYLVDVVKAPLDRAMERIAGYAAKGVKKGKLSEEQAAAVTKNLIPTLDYGALANCDWVLEAATENLELKRKIFRQVEAIVRPDAILTSNTSSLPAARMLADLTRKNRATVTHFFAPAFQNPAVEVIRWDGCDASLVDYLRWFFAYTGKVPFQTTDAVCFMLDRVFDNWCNDAAHLLDRATTSQIDTVAQEFVHAGPFQVLNLAKGNPIIVETNTLQMEEEGAHYKPAEILRSVETWKTPQPGARIDVDEATKATVRDRLLGVLFSQSVDILDRRIARAEDLDLGCVLALGFKKGPLELMRDMGKVEVERVLARYATERPGMPMPKKSVDAYLAFDRKIEVDRIDDAVVITLRRPQALNALDDELTDEIASVMARYENDPTVAGFVLTGYGTRAFCAGADIGRLADVLGKESEAAEYARDCSRLLVRMDASKKPIVAAVNGMALGGGLELAMRCHALVATKDAWMQFPEVTLGIAPGIGGMVVPYRRWPKASPVFHDMLRFAKKLRAVEALELGIVERLADSYDELVRVAIERMRSLAGNIQTISNAPATIAPFGSGPDKKPSLGKEVVGIVERAIENAAKASTLEAALEIGYCAFGTSACTKAASEGVGAFLSGRKPDFETTG